MSSEVLEETAGGPQLSRSALQSGASGCYMLSQVLGGGLINFYKLDSKLEIFRNEVSAQPDSAQCTLDSASHAPARECGCSRTSCIELLCLTLRIFGSQVTKAKEDGNLFVTMVIMRLTPARVWPLSLSPAIPLRTGRAPCRNIDHVMTCHYIDMLIDCHP